MKKTLIIAVVMMLALAVSANAYIMKGVLTEPSGSGGGYFQFADIGPSTGTYMPPAGSDWCAIAAVEGTSLLVKNWQPTNTSWDFVVWGDPAYSKGTAILSLQVQSFGNDENQGAAVAGQTWALYDAQGSVLKQFVLEGATKTNLFTLEIPVVNTADALNGGTYYSFGEYSEVVPEPGSIVALASGLVGLAGFGIRRRK